MAKSPVFAGARAKSNRLLARPERDPVIPITIRNATIRLVLLARGIVIIPQVIRDSHRSSALSHPKTTSRYSTISSCDWYYKVTCSLTGANEEAPLSYGEKAGLL
jgi:hypothetical protein